MTAAHGPQQQPITPRAEDIHEPSFGKHILFFDGVCGFCNMFVQFVLENDKRDRFHFASLQSDFARKTLSPRGIDPSQLDTMYIITNYGNSKERLLDKSDAAVFAAKQLQSWLDPFATIFGFLPKQIRDFAYTAVTKIRYLLMGKVEHCTLPTEEASKKFIA